jgi:hypothetical protein
MQMKSINIIILAFILAGTFYPLATETAISAEHPDFTKIVGEWVRPDGGYIVHVRDVKSDGSADVGYFNPAKINVAAASVSYWKGLVKLLIKLQDKGYPGSTYTLYYYADKDTMAGFYYQAVMRQTFEVVFTRKPSR